MSVSSPVIVALDYPDMNLALAVANQLDPEVCRVKVGKELFTAEGPVIIQKLAEKGFDVFLDLKFHDIPSTTGKAISAAARKGVWMVNLHASGGEHMMRACREALDALNLECPPLLIAVTVLTSMMQDDLEGVGVDTTPDKQVIKLALLAKNSGMDGVVCSAEETPVLRDLCGPDFVLVTPGIRPASHTVEDDQRRVVSPKKALANGSDYLVIGRPITKAGYPGSALKAVIEEL